MTSTTGSPVGFSLVEILVVVGVISSVTLVCSLHFQNHLSGALLKTSAQELVSTLSWARRLAITKRQTHKVVFQTERGIYWIEDKDGARVEQVAHLKKGIVFANPGLGKWGEADGLVETGIPDDAITFYPQGTAEAGSIYLQDQDNKKWYTVTITPTTGAVIIYARKN